MPSGTRGGADALGRGEVRDGKGDAGRELEGLERLRHAETGAVGRGDGR